MNTFDIINITNFPKFQICRCYTSTLSIFFASMTCAKGAESAAMNAACTCDASMVIAPNSKFLVAQASDTKIQRKPKYTSA
jgi:hypothetical protein